MENVVPTGLRAIQVAATPMIANIWGQDVSGAIENAIGVGFTGNPAPLTPNGAGFTYYWNADPAAQGSAASAQDGLKRFVAAPDQSGNDIYDDFSALGYARLPTKAPPPPAAPPRDWLGWIDVRAAGLNNGTAGADLTGNQLDVITGLTHRLAPNLVVGGFGGYENFSFSSLALNGTLKGSGWTTGTYVGWSFAPHLRFDAGGAWSYLDDNDVSGIAAGNFTGQRWLTTGGVTGTYGWRALVLEPSARLYVLWEHENGYNDSLGNFQAARDFSTGRASGGMKISYPFATGPLNLFVWSRALTLAPYAGLYGDYYLSSDNAAATGLTSIPLLQGWSARATAGLAATAPSGAQFTAGGEYGGIGSVTHIWTWQVSGRVPI